MGKVRYAYWLEAMEDFLSYDEEDSRVMKREGEMGVFFFFILKIAYILGENEYEKMPYRTYLSKYTDFDEYENNLMNSFFGND